MNIVRKSAVSTVYAKRPELSTSLQISCVTEMLLVRGVTGW